MCNNDRKMYLSDLFPTAQPSNGGKMSSCSLWSLDELMVYKHLPPTAPRASIRLNTDSEAPKQCGNNGYLKSLSVNFILQVHGPGWDCIVCSWCMGPILHYLLPQALIPAQISPKAVAAGGTIIKVCGMSPTATNGICRAAAWDSLRMCTRPQTGVTGGNYRGTVA